MTTDVNWQSLLRPALAALALSSDEQTKANGPGCVACDLLEDFKHAHVFVVGTPVPLSVEQRAILEQINNAICSMQPADIECFSNEVLRRPAWQKLRDLSAIALKKFGWTGTIVPPFSEVNPGVWSRE